MSLKFNIITQVASFFMIKTKQRLSKFVLHTNNKTNALQRQNYINFLFNR
ncbi:hypothetical protein C8P70_101112 [Myroides indicus]|uniref:Uncharacterized protein n=1 Tax=Myroides indicus TaxID=1323422 RepID=A0A4R7FEP6_9FLAO|nr:hypothetical protein C8P70_101112 [Myroides indicus]